MFIGLWSAFWIIVFEKRAWKSAFSSTLWGVLVLGLSPLNGSERKPDEGINDVSLSMKLLVCPVVQKLCSCFVLRNGQCIVQTFLRDLKFFGKCFANGSTPSNFRTTFALRDITSLCRSLMLLFISRRVEGSFFVDNISLIACTGRLVENSAVNFFMPSIKTALSVSRRPHHQT